MAFNLNDIGKKISETTQSVVQKSNDSVEVARKKAQVASEERTQAQIFEEIGRLYVQLHAEDAEADLKAGVEQILESRKRIDILNNEIMDLKGIALCPACGAEVQRGSAFCPICGKAIPAPAVPDGMKRCAGCNALISLDKKFCPNCGTQQPEIETPAPAEEAAPAEPVAEKFCPSCGEKLHPEAAFCKFCGSRV